MIISVRRFFAMGGALFMLAVQADLFSADFRLRSCLRLRRVPFGSP